MEIKEKNSVIVTAWCMKHLKEVEETTLSALLLKAQKLKKPSE